MLAVYQGYNWYRSHCNEPEISTMQRDSGFDEHFLRSILSLKVFSDQDDPLECSFLLFSSEIESILGASIILRRKNLTKDPWTWNEVWATGGNPIKEI